MHDEWPEGGHRLRRVATADLTQAEAKSIRAIMDEAFGTDEEERFTDDDWEHALGGTHFVLDLDGEIVGHASVVERRLELGGRPVRTGYVEAVAVATGRQGGGFGSVLMTDVNAWIADHFELGALGTGRRRFYERLGWLTWRGPVICTNDRRRTAHGRGRRLHHGASHARVTTARPGGVDHLRVATRRRLVAPAPQHVHVVYAAPIKIVAYATEGAGDG